METITLRIDYPKSAQDKKRWSREFSLNAYYAGKHYRVRQRDAQFWHRLTHAAISDAGIKHNQQPFRRPVIIRFWWNDRLDIDNHAAMGKMIVDGLKGWIIADDNRKHLASVQHFWHNEEYIKIEIEECDGTKQKGSAKE